MCIYYMLSTFVFYVIYLNVFQLVIYCSITNYPKTWWLKVTFINS